MRMRPSRCCRLSASACDRGIEIRGDERTRKIIPIAKTASEEDYYTEYLGPVISVKVVASLDEAIEHINHYSSQHTETIVTRDLAAARQFAARVDSSAVMVNASTRFNDGGEFGLGAEIGISTDKFHARGPCGLNELTSYKYVVYGNGQGEAVNDNRRSLANGSGEPAQRGMGTSGEKPVSEPPLKSARVRRR